MSIKRLSETVSLHCEGVLMEGPSTHTASGGEGTQGTVDNYPHFKTRPQLFHHLALAAPATDRKLEGVSENVAEDISNAYLYSDARQSEPNVCTLERN